MRDDRRRHRRSKQLASRDGRHSKLDDLAEQCEMMREQLDILIENSRAPSRRDACEPAAKERTAPNHSRLVIRALWLVIVLLMTLTTSLIKHVCLKLG